MRKLVLSGICVLASTLAFACSSGKSQQAGAFDNGTAGSANGGAGGSGGQASTGGAGGSSQAAPYPDGPYGYNVGDTLGPDQTFYGYPNPQKANFGGDLQPIKLSDFYDPDGSKGIKVILFDVGAVWCQYCRQEESEILSKGYYATYKPKGAEFFSVLFEAADGSPSKPSDLQTWTKTYQSDYPNAIDPGFWFGHFFNSNAAPLNMFVNARTMKIIDEQLGYGQAAQWSALDGYLSQVK